MREEFSQNQYQVYRLKLPFCVVCTPKDGIDGTWHTPITCEEESTTSYYLWFATQNAPTVIYSSAGQRTIQPESTYLNLFVKSPLNSKVFKCVTSANESTPVIKPGKGMSSRSTISLTMEDFDGDPGPINFSDKGSFFGKLLARNILDGKELKVYNYSITNDTNYLISTSTYFIESAHLSQGKLKLTGKDALRDVEAFGQQYPAPSDVTLTTDINATQTSIPVSDGSYLAASDRFVIGEEIFTVVSVSTNTITTSTRGNGKVNADGTRVYSTNTGEHKAGDTVQKCVMYNKKFLSLALKEIFDAVGLSSYVDYTQWFDEIDEWSSSAHLYGIITEPTEAIDLIDEMLQVYMVDMWLDQSTQKVKVSAVSAWKEAIRTLSEVNDIQNLKIKTNPNQRFSRAYITHKKPLQALSDDKENYTKYTVYTDVAKEDSDLYGSVKLYEFDPCRFISDSSATQLVLRFVQRFSDPPKEISFNIEERKLAGTGLGDIVDIVSRDTQLPDGTEYGARISAQITQLKPVVNSIGRYYAAKALSYIPLIDPSGGPVTIFISGVVSDVNLYDRAGAPSGAVDITFVIQNATMGSSTTQYAMRAGNFDSGSTIKIICTQGTQWSAKGGDGGDANELYSYNGTNGHHSYQSDGITTSIYLNYGGVDGYTTDGELFAAGGGGGGARAESNIFQNSPPIRYAAVSGGGGGSGIPGGSGGTASALYPAQIGYSSFGNSVFNNGFDGTFSSDGNGDLAEFIYTPTNQTPVLCYDAKGSDGGFAVNSPNNGYTNEYYTPFNTTVNRSTGSSGNAGAAFKGINITVYNLSASSSKLKDGNSDSYTLITS